MWKLQNRLLIELNERVNMKISSFLQTENHYLAVNKTHVYYAFQIYANKSPFDFNALSTFHYDMIKMFLSHIISSLLTTNATFLLREKQDIRNILTNEINGFCDHLFYILSTWVLNFDLLVAKATVVGEIVRTRDCQVKDVSNVVFTEKLVVCSITSVPEKYIRYHFGSTNVERTTGICPSRNISLDSSNSVDTFDSRGNSLTLLVG